MKKFTWMMFFILGMVTFSFAQDEELAPVTRTIAVTNVNIVPAPGQLIENGTVLMKDGIITAVGKNVSVPPGARIVKGDSLYIYPGFILGMSHVGIKMPKRDERPEVKVPGNPPDELAGITPERGVLEFLVPADKSVSEYRSLGFTLAQTAPEGGMLPGQSSLILLKGNNADEMVMNTGTAMYATFEGARRMYPATTMGVMAKFRELYRQAEQAKKFRQMYSAEPAGMQRPFYDRTLIAFYPVLDRKIPVAYKGTGVLDAQRAILLKEELGFDLILTELRQGWDIVQKVKNSNTKVLFSLDMPEWKPLDKKDTVKEEEQYKEQEIIEGLEKRKEEFAKRYYGQPALYQQAGVPFAFSSVDTKITAKDIKGNLHKMVENGLSEDAALAALTTTPASIYGLSRMAGTIENGKMANLVVSDKPFFDKESNVRYVFVEGDLFEYEVKAKKKSDKKAAARLAGNWSYSAETPNGTITGTIKLAESDGVLTGSIDNSYNDEVSELNDVLITGNSLTFNFKTRILAEQKQVNAVLNIEGDSFEGTLSSPGIEIIPIKGTKKPQK
ncbi:MAG: amidohydrolase family protein [Candidatus Cyclobacteriaceae bacterium M2_1C_046]